MHKLKTIIIICWFMFSMMILLTIENKNELLFQGRSSLEFPKFNIDSFLTTEFQNDAEKALSDQIYYSDELKQFKTYLDTTLYKNTFSRLTSKDSYNLAVDQRFFYKNDDYLVSFPMCYPWIEINSSITNKIAHSYNRVKDVKKYYYYINNSDTLDFETNANCINEDVKNKYNTFNFDSFEIKDYKEYKKYFYKTDFHWNHVASYKGYQDIIRMMKGENEKILKPKEEKKLTNEFYGDIARNNQYFYIKDEFSRYYFDFNKHKKYVNGRLEDKEFSEIYVERRKVMDYYAKEYGWTIGEIIYDFNDSSKENLLIITNSFGRPISKLIASHYNKTHIIDLRGYQDFNIDEYIRKNNIDTFLVINSGLYYADYIYKLKGV